MVKFTVTSAKCGSPQKFWCEFSDRFEGGKIRKISGFFSPQQIKVDQFYQI